MRRSGRGECDQNSGEHSAHWRDPVRAQEGQQQQRRRASQELRGGRGRVSTGRDGRARIQQLARLGRAVHARRRDQTRAQHGPSVRRARRAGQGVLWPPLQLDCQPNQPSHSAHRGRVSALH